MKEEKIFGIHAVNSILAISPWRIKQLFIIKNNPRLQAIITEAQTQQIKIEWSERKNLDKLIQGNHQGVIAICQAQKAMDETVLFSLIENEDTPLLFLVLDNVEDPHNVGACLRSADAFGANALVVPKHHACGLTETVKKVACGAAETVPFIEVNNLARVMQNMQQKNIWFYGLSMNAKKNIDQIQFPKRSALVLGAEATGLRRLTTEHCDELIKIPMQGTVESLNISVAAGISLFVAQQKLGVIS